MSTPNNIVFSSVQKYKAYLDNNGASPELTANTAILVEGLEKTAEDDGAGWSTVGIGHSISHGGKHIFEKAGLDWNKFNSTGRMSDAEAKQLFMHGDYQRFKAIATHHLDKEWFEKQPQNFQDAVVLEVFNKGERGFFHVAKETEGYTDTVDTAKIAKLKSEDPKQIFEAFTTGQSVSGSRKQLTGGNGDTVRERLASRRPWAGALAIAHLTEQPGVVPAEYFDAMAADPLLATMDKEEIIARSVKYTNTRGELNLEGAKIGDYVPTPETEFAYNGSGEKKKRVESSTPNPTGRGANGRRKDDFLYDIQDLPPEAQLFLMLFAVILGAFDEEMSAKLLDSIGGFSPQQRNSAMDSIPQQYTEGLDRQTPFKPSGDVGQKSGYSDPAPDMGKFNYDLLTTKFEKSAIYPVANAPEKVITSDFGPRNVAGGSRVHPAFDLRAKAGDGVLSMFEGEVVKIGQNSLKVQNNNGTITTYFHVDGDVSIGTKINAGDRIATVLPKCSRNPYDPHLDVRTQDAKSGIYIHPSQYMETEGLVYKDGAKCKTDCRLIDKSGDKIISTDSVKEKMAERGLDLQASNSNPLEQARQIGLQSGLSLQNPSYNISAPLPNMSSGLALT